MNISNRKARLISPRHYAYFDSSLTIGSEEGNDLLLQGPTVAARHAVLVLDVKQDSFFIKACDPKNEVFVNKKRLTEPSFLQNGDEVSFGEEEEVFLLQVFEQVVRNAQVDELLRKAGEVEKAAFEKTRKTTYREKSELFAQASILLDSTVLGKLMDQYTKERNGYLARLQSTSKDDLPALISELSARGKGGDTEVRHAKKKVAEKWHEIVQDIELLESCSRTLDEKLLSQNRLIAAAQKLFCTHAKQLSAFRPTTEEPNIVSVEPLIRRILADKPKENLRAQNGALDVPVCAAIGRKQPTGDPKLPPDQAIYAPDVDIYIPNYGADVKINPFTRKPETGAAANADILLPAQTRDQNVHDILIPTRDVPIGARPDPTRRDGPISLQTPPAGQRTIFSPEALPSRLADDHLIGLCGSAEQLMHLPKNGAPTVSESPEIAQVASIVASITAELTQATQAEARKTEAIEENVRRLSKILEQKKANLEIKVRRFSQFASELTRLRELQDFKTMLEALADSPSEAQKLIQFIDDVKAFNARCQEFIERKSKQKSKFEVEREVDTKLQRLSAQQKRIDALRRELDTLRRENENAFGGTDVSVNTPTARTSRERSERFDFERSDPLFLNLLRHKTQ